jgi:hypothetical protein
MRRGFKVQQSLAPAGSFGLSSMQKRVQGPAGGEASLSASAAARCRSGRENQAGTVARIRRGR